MKTKRLLLLSQFFAFIVAAPSSSRGQVEAAPEAAPAAAQPDILLKEADADVSVANGSIFSLDAESLSLTPEKSAIPLVFATTSATPLVDEEEKPVVRDLIRTGIAATVHYTTVGEKLIATKIIVTRKTLAGAGPADATAAARKRAELTQTKVLKDEARIKALASEGGGTLMGFEQILSVRMPGEVSMTQYTVNNSTLYVDSVGNPVPPHAVRTGASLHVHFVEDAGRKIATRVTIKSMPPWVLEGVLATERGTPSGTQATRENSSGELSDGFIYPPIVSLPTAVLPGNDSSAVDSHGRATAGSAQNGDVIEAQIIPNQPNAPQPGAPGNNPNQSNPAPQPSTPPEK